MYSIRKVRDAGIKFRIGVVRMLENKADIENIKKLMLLEKFILKESLFLPDDVRPVGRGKEHNCLLSKQKYIPYLHINRAYFNMAHYWNTCWGGELAITSQGQILPCVFARDQIIGNIYHQNLKEVINGNAQKYWKITSNKIKKCKDCEYRYACMDCRVLSLKAGRGLLGRPVRCGYDPYH